MRILDPCSKVGACACVGLTPPAGATTATITVNLSAPDLTSLDPVKYLRLRIEADYGAGYQLMLRSPDWHSALDAIFPTLSWDFSNSKPLLVRGVVENGLNGDGSAVSATIDLTFQ